MRIKSLDSIITISEEKECILIENKAWNTGDSAKLKMMIAVDGDGGSYRKYGLDPYFKIYHYSANRYAEGVSRIYFDRPEYVYPPHGRDSFGNEQLPMPRDLLKLFIKTMNKHPEIWKKMNDMRVVVTMRYINELKKDRPGYKVVDFYELPDYSLLNK